MSSGEEVIKPPSVRRVPVAGGGPASEGEGKLPRPEGRRGASRVPVCGRRRPGRDPTAGLPRETRPAKGGGGSPGSPKGGAGADPATAGQTHGPEGARPPVPLVPPWVARAPGYLSVGPMQAVSVLSISRRIRSCSAAVSRLSASAILPRSVDWGAPQRVLPPSAPLT